MKIMKLLPIFLLIYSVAYGMEKHNITERVPSLKEVVGKSIIFNEQLNDKIDQANIPIELKEYLDSLQKAYANKLLKLYYTNQKFEDKQKSIYLAEQAVKNCDSSFNFKQLKANIDTWELEFKPKLSNEEKQKINEDLERVLKLENISYDKVEEYTLYIGGILESLSLSKFLALTENKTYKTKTALMLYISAVPSYISRLIDHYLIFNCIKLDKLFTIIQDKTCDVISYIISKSDTINYQDDEGKTALIYAVLIGSSSIVKLLLDNGADADRHDNTGKTALMYAAENNYADIVEMLIKSGVYKDAQDNKGFTALMCAACKGHKESIKLLIDAGADTEEKSITGNDAAFYSVKRGKRDCLNLLLSQLSDDCYDKKLVKLERLYNKKERMKRRLRRI